MVIGTYNSSISNKLKKKGKILQWRNLVYGFLYCNLLCYNRYSISITFFLMYLIF